MRPASPLYSAELRLGIICSNGRMGVLTDGNRWYPEELEERNADRVIGWLLEELETKPLIRVTVSGTFENYNAYCTALAKEPKY